MTAPRKECPTCGRPVPIRTPLTRRQAETLTAIRTAIASRGYAPSFVELAEALGLHSLSTVHEHLQTLEAKGYIRRVFNASRGIELVDDAVLDGSRPVESPQSPIEVPHVA